MARALTANSETAQDIAAAFMKFQEPVSDEATEITAIISELYAICSALLELKTALNDPRYYRRRRHIEDDQRDVLLSLEYTFKDIKRQFAGLEKPIYRTNREAYHGVWNSILRYFLDEGNNSLVERLEYYRRFLMELGTIVKGSVYSKSWLMPKHPDKA